MLGRPKGTKNKWDSRWNIPIQDRFWEKVDKKSDDECWNWLAFVHPTGYGMFALNRKMVLAHRISWMLSFGDIPNGMLVCHKCDNRKCVNPNHLFIGTFQDNINDREMKDRGKIPCNRGERHGMSKLKETEVLMIRELFSMGVNVVEIANKFNVSHKTISKVAHRRSWSWLK